MSAKEIAMRRSRFFLVMFASLAVLVESSAAQLPPAHRFNAPTVPVFTSLVSFDQTNGAYPGGSTLIQATDGNLYGTTVEGAANSYGTVFKVTPGGTLTSLYSFCSQTYCADGSYPSGGLVQGIDGNFYGVTVKGGVYGYGTVYRITMGGLLTTLHSFDSTDDGANPAGTLVQSNGSFYGITQYYGGGTHQQGTVYKITPAGKVTTLYYFCSQPNCADGSFPQPALLQAGDGNFYGETAEGGAEGACSTNYGCGTVFRITPSGTLTTLHSFAGYPDDGDIPGGGLVQAADLNLYGTSLEGGANNYGTAFRISPRGVLSTIYSFCVQEMRNQCLAGRSPYGGLVQGTDGNLYGATYAGGANGYGTVYSLTIRGRLTIEHSFNSTDGAYPANSDLVQGTDGSFYGSTQNGGADGVGTLYNLNVGLAPFVETQTASAKVGSSVVILGTNLTDATGVTFNGVAAVFTVESNSEIIATVPTGATTGPVVVTTPTGTLTSNKNFRISK